MLYCKYLTKLWVIFKTISVFKPSQYCRGAISGFPVSRKTLEFFWNLENPRKSWNLAKISIKALENPAIYFHCYFLFSVIEIRVMFYLLSSNLKLISCSFLVVLVFNLLSCKVLFINRKDNRNNKEDSKLGKLLQNYKQLESNIFKVFWNTLEVVFQCYLNLHGCTFWSISPVLVFKKVSFKCLQNQVIFAT